MFILLPLPVLSTLPLKLFSFRKRPQFLFPEIHVCVCVHFSEHVTLCDCISVSVCLCTHLRTHACTQNLLTCQKPEARSKKGITLKIHMCFVLINSSFFFLFLFGTF